MIQGFVGFNLTFLKQNIGCSMIDKIKKHVKIVYKTERLILKVHSPVYDLSKYKLNLE